MATERQAPDAILASLNYTTLNLADVDEDPDSPDASYGTWDGNGNTDARVSFPTPTGPPTVGAGLQEFRALIRRTGAASLGWSLELFENGASVSVLATGTLTTTSTVISGTWNASSLGTPNGSLVECRVLQTSGGTGGGRQGIELGAVEWNVTYTPVTTVNGSFTADAFIPGRFTMDAVIKKPWGGGDSLYLRSTGPVATTATDTVTADIPGSAQAGDELMALFWWDSSATITASPGGWTQAINNPQAVSFALYRRVHNGSDTQASLTISAAPTTALKGIILNHGPSDFGPLSGNNGSVLAGQGTNAAPATSTLGASFSTYRQIRRLTGFATRTGVDLDAGGGGQNVPILKIVGPPDLTVYDEGLATGGASITFPATTWTLTGSDDWNSFRKFIINTKALGFNVDAFIAGHLTLDAVVRRTQTGSFTLNAVIQRTQEFSYDVFRRVYPLPFDYGTRKAIFDGTRWVIVSFGNTIIAYSSGARPDNLTANSPMGAYARWIAYNGTHYVVVGHEVGENAMIYTATDPTSTWTRNALQTASTLLNSVAYGNGVWVAVASNGNIYTATDPTSTWTENTTDTLFSGGNAQSVTYAQGRWVIAGTKIGYATDPTGQFTDAASYDMTPLSAISPYFTTVEYARGYWIASGYQVNTNYLWITQDPTGTWTKYTTAMWTSDPNGGDRTGVRGISASPNRWGNSGGREDDDVGHGVYGGIQSSTAADPTSGWALIADPGSSVANTALNLVGLTYASGYWVAVGDAGANEANAGKVFWAQTLSIDAFIAGRFTLDAVISAGATVVNGSFTADAVIKREQTGSFSANAVIAKELLNDPFTRTVASGLGVSPQGHVYQLQFGHVEQTSVNGSTMVVAAGADSSSHLGIPLIAEGVVQFDFFVPSTIAGLGYIAVDGKRTTQNAALEVFASAGRVWVDTYFGAASVDFVPLTSTWYTAKGTFVAPGQTTRVKVWRVGDAEPDWQNSGTAPAVAETDTIGPAVLDSDPTAQSYGIDNLWIRSFVTDWSIKHFVTANAIIRRNQTSSFTANAVVKATRSGSFTANAVVRRAQAGSITADAVVKATASGSLTVNAVIRRAGAGSFTANAVLRATVSGSVTANADIKATITGSFTVNAVTLRAGAGSFTGDAVARRTQTGSATADAVVKATIAGTFTADAYIAGVNTFAFSADAVLRATTASTFTVDAVLVQGTVEGSFSADAAIRRTQTGSLTVNAVTLRAITGAITIDAVVFRTQTGSLAANAVILRAQTGSFTADALISRTTEGSFSADAAIRATQTGSLTVNAVIKTTQTASFTANAVIFATVSSSFTANAVLLKAGTGSLTADAIVSRTTTGSLTVNAVIKATVAGSLTVNAVLKWTQAGALTANAVVFATRSGSFTLDAFIPARLTADAVVRRTQAGSFTLNAFVAGRLTANAVIKRNQTGTFTIDAFVPGGNVSVVTADAVIRATQAGSFTANATKRTTTQGSLSANAVLLRNQTGSFTANALIKRTQTGSFPENAVVKASATGAVTIDAKISQSIGNALTLNAVLLRAVQGTFSAQAVLFSTRSGTFAINAIRRVTATGSWTLDAVIEKTATASITASADIQAPRTGGVTADAVILSPRTGSFDLDAYVAQLGEDSFFVDAVISLPALVGSFTVNAVLRRPVEVEYIEATLSAQLMAATVSATAAAATLTATVIEARLFSPRIGSLTVDAVIV